MIYANVKQLGKYFRKPLQASLVIPALAAANVALAESSADIDQEGGTTNQANIVQIDTTNAFGHILQDGVTNYATILQIGPSEGLISATITQYGTSNEAILEQQTVDEMASADVIQGGTANVAEAYQTGVVEVSLLMDQAGEANFAIINQSLYDGAADITQRGTNNYAQVDQYGGPLPFDASVYQEGGTNTTTVLQEGDADGVVITHQIGNNNLIDVYQYNTGAPTGVEAIVTTQGDDNVAMVTQDSAWFTSFNMTQTGDGNTVEAIQGGSTAKIYINSRNSNFNSDFISQDGVLFSEITLERHGTDTSSTSVIVGGYEANVALEQLDSFDATIAVTQTGVFGSSVGISQSAVESTSAIADQTDTLQTSASIEQAGVSTSSAVITQTQAGDEALGLIASIYQSDSADLMAAIEQTGADNEALIRQMNTSGVEAYIVQGGTGHYAEITQTGGTDSGNTATVNQTGEGYSAAISQAGTDNLATIVQM